MNLKTFFCLNIIFLFGFSKAFSQEKDTIPPKDSVFEIHKNFTLKPTTDFDQRFSFFRGSKVNIWGQKAGVLINEKLKVGVGGYFLKDYLKGSKLYNTSTPDFYVKRNLKFGTFYVEPFLFRKSWWELSVPFEIGFGKTILQDYAVVNDNLIASGVKYFFPTGAGLSLSLKLPPGEHYKPFRWVGINFLVGYRYDLDEHVYNTDYDGMFWSISGAVFLDRVVTDYKGWKKKKNQNPVSK
ncbi:MAG: hypothetical protein ACXVPY_15245 [Bacteroidia bacterium]